MVLALAGTDEGCVVYLAGQTSSRTCRVLTWGTHIRRVLWRFWGGHALGESCVVYLEAHT